MNFPDAVDAHLSTIARRDVDGYLATLHPDVTMIMPNGRLLTGRDEVADLHRGWFADPDWSWKLEPRTSATAGDTGVAVYAADYHDLDAEGRPYELSYLLSLVFVRDGERWLLLHDQNTLR